MTLAVMADALWKPLFAASTGINFTGGIMIIIIGYQERKRAVSGSLNVGTEPTPQGNRMTYSAQQPNAELY